VAADSQVAAAADSQVAMAPGYGLRVTAPIRESPVPGMPRPSDGADVPVAASREAHASVMFERGELHYVGGAAPPRARL